MAVTRYADFLNQTPDIWGKTLTAQAEKQTFWKRWEGPEGSSMPIWRKDQLLVEAGDVINMDAVLALGGPGQTGDLVLLEGNEEKLKARQISVTVESLQNAVRWGKKPSILNIYNLRTTGLGQLRKWLAGALDNMIFSEFCGRSLTNPVYTPTITEANLPTTMQYFAGSATSIATVADSDAAGRLKLSDISIMKALAMTQNLIEPIKLDNGEEVYGLVLHNYTALQLKLDASWQQAQRDAQIRGAGNPLFTGALGMWDNVILFSSNRIMTNTDGVSSAVVARNVFFGAQALARAWAYYPDWTEQEFSYGQETGIATYSILGHRLYTFDFNATSTGATTDDTALGAMILYAAAPTPAA